MADRYEVLTGLNYPDDKKGEHRAEVGDVVEDLPVSSVEWLLEAGYIAPTDKPVGKAKRDEPEPEAEPKAKKARPKKGKPEEPATDQAEADEPAADPEGSEA